MVETLTRNTGTSQSPENITNDETRVIDGDLMAVGDHWAQGDVCLVRIARLPKSAKPRKDRQLAEGDTQGSRHVCTVGDVYDCDPEALADSINRATGGEVSPQYVGPVIVTVDGVADIRHPEHGDHEYRGEGIVLACVFQRSLDAEEREAKVRD